MPWQVLVVWLATSVATTASVEDSLFGQLDAAKDGKRVSLEIV